jgi:hypothetical protein
MNDDEIRSILDDAESFLRESDPTAALSRAKEAVRACEACWRVSIALVADARLLRDRCEVALARARADDVSREARWTARERREAASPLTK